MHYISMAKKKGMFKFIIYLLGWLVIPLWAQANVRGVPEDSLKVICWLTDMQEREPEDILYFARKFLTVPYKAGSLDNGKKEALTVDISSFDCVTFVETVLALAFTDREQGPHYKDFLKNLQLIRYRDGKIDGYGSRLHYFSDWIQNNEQKGFIKEITQEIGGTPGFLDISFMTAHVDNYPSLKNDSINKVIVEEQEKKLSGTPFYCLLKSNLTNRNLSHIQNGNIIALVTSVKGLDISHVGFAIWENNELHLLHASARYGKVVIEPVSLKKYIFSNSKWIGIRVLAVN